MGTAVKYPILSKKSKQIPPRILELIGALEPNDCMSQQIWEDNGIGKTLLVSEEFWDAIHSVRVLQSMEDPSPDAQDSLVQAKAFVYDIMERIAIELYTDAECHMLDHMARRHPYPCVTVYYEEPEENF